MSIRYRIGDHLVTGRTGYTHHGNHFWHEGGMAAGTLLVTAAPAAAAVALGYGVYKLARWLV
ncbi:MAG: hypothetical protein Q8O14_02160 [bacterium]|nr:hypothetical protein [bacterium]